MDIKKLIKVPFVIPSVTLSVNMKYLRNYSRAKKSISKMWMNSFGNAEEFI